MENLIPAVERSFSSEDTKTYNFSAEVLTPKKDIKVLFKNPVNVYGDDKSLIGTVILERSGNVIMGDFTIDYSTPERLNLETHSIAMLIDAHVLVTPRISMEITKITIRTH